MPDIEPVVLVLACVAIVFSGRAWLRGRALKRLAIALGGTVVGGVAVFAHDGVELRLRRVIRRLGKHRLPWTYVDAPLPPGEPLQLNIVAHGWFERGRIARGTLTDLVTGDAEFDRRYRVEAAPADVVVRVLDDEVRGYLVGASDAELTTEGGRLRLAVGGWGGLDRVRRTATTARSIIAGLRTAHAELDRQDGRVRLVGDPHRGIPSDEAVQGARAARVAEAERLERVLDARARRVARLSLAGMIAGWGAAAAVVIMMLTGH